MSIYDIRNIDLSKYMDSKTLLNTNYSSAEKELFSANANSNSSMSYNGVDNQLFSNFSLNSQYPIDMFLPSNNSFSQKNNINWGDLWQQSLDMYKNKLSMLMSQFGSLGCRNCESLQNVNYDKAKAQELAKSAQSHAGAKSKHACAEYVNNALENVGLGAGRGDAYTLINRLGNNKNFKEVSVTRNDLDNLPPGCILVYPRGAAGYDASAGHTEITLGNGTAASDFINSNIKYSPNIRVYVSV